jgi:hypothetical protein
MCGLLFALGCTDDPMPGDPCDPDDPPIFFDGSSEPLPSFCQGTIDMIPAPRPCSLICTGPAGCGEDIVFRWKVEPEEAHGPSGTFSLGLEWCGCDGQTARSHFHEPTGRWQWFGTCEDPCDHVIRFGSEWLWYVGPGFEPVNPACAECSRASLVDGQCRSPEGLHISDDCCRCYVDPDNPGRCIACGEGIEVSAMCCDRAPPPANCSL